MVTIESLRFYNGFTYRECLMPLDRQGFVFLSGANGHGKSTPFEILQHILYGSTSRGIRKDGINCLVPGTDGFFGEVVLRNPDGRWRIRQSRNHSKYKTQVKVFREVEGKWALSWEDGACPKKLEDAQKLAASLVGLQLHEFAGCVYLSQASVHTLIDGTPAEKLRYVSQLFGLDVLDTMLQALKGKLKQAELEVKDAPLAEQTVKQLREEAQAFDAPSHGEMHVVADAVTAGETNMQHSQEAYYAAQRDRERAHE
jgi:DNA repair exonuclease SbcCD ATPase subunit